MRQIVQNYKTGALELLDVPVPACRSGGVLVRSMFSLISAGTEMMKVSEAKLSLVGKVRARPDQVKKVLTAVQQQGVLAAYQKAMNKLDSYSPLGYSLSGVVIEVGDGAEEFRVGQMVACAGNQYALHAEVNWVPVNLVAAVPDGVDARQAAFTTVGAVAMQGLRQGEVQLGETAVVIGLGLIGQILTQLLVASGVRVVGVDLSEARCQRAVGQGAVAATAPGDGAAEEIVRAHTNGFGADVVFLAAGGPTNEPVELAAKVARDRGRVVDIGKCKLDLPWNEYYEKELDFRFSRSYGPGRYDALYEEGGVDYPIGYVRWTEQRNLACFLDLLARKRIDLGALVDHVAPFAEAVKVYEELDSGARKGVGFLFQYPEHVDLGRVVTPSVTTDDPLAERRLRNRSAARTAVGVRPVRLGFIGAGNYASSMLLPHLKDRPDVNLVEVATSSSLSAMNAQRKFGFARASTDIDSVLSDDAIDAVFVVTRHASHASLACRALAAGKAVFVEKPLAIADDQIEAILNTVETTGNDRIMVGFNRRFAPMLVDLRQRMGRRSGPAMVRYLVNAGRLGAHSWYLNAAGEGSRFEGEGGHFIDTISWWLDAQPMDVSAVATPDDADNLAATVTYDDGSIASIVYGTNGHARFPKETFEALADGRVARMDNFKSAAVTGGRRARKLRARGGVDKGQRAELDAFLAALRSGAPMPIALTSLVSTTRTTLAATRALASRVPERIKISR